MQEEKPFLPLDESGGLLAKPVEERLAAYYGPELREQALPSSSWQRLHAQLGPQRSRRHLRVPQLRRPWHRRFHSIPVYVQETFVRIMHDARISYPPSSLLHCSFNAAMPSVRVSVLGRIKLLLPSSAKGAIGTPELDVLVATGLARYLCTRKPVYAIARVLLIIAVLLASAVSILLFWSQKQPLVVIPIAILLCALALLHIQGCNLAFRADTLMVLWLGRTRACRGLHALADQSRSPRLVRWGEPSLTERISRVCGTRVAIEDERLTLVR
jgi:hypothetical protein